jgi:hypothetical protein
MLFFERNELEESARGFLLEEWKMHLNVIWTQAQDSLVETTWIRWLLQEFEITEHVAPGLDLFLSDALYIVSGNQHPFSGLPSSFLEGIRGVNGKGLFHISDEWYSGGYEIYRNFDFVLRNYHSTLFRNPGIKSVPLGFTNLPTGAFQIQPANRRRLLWSFAGAKSAARTAMIDSLRNIGPSEYYIYDSRKQQKPALDRKAFTELLSESVFSPCPMGNVMLETFRVYESLEMGCIPIVECRPWMPYYDHLLPGHPIPTFPSWGKARSFVEAMSKNEPGLVDYQRTVANWWQGHKVRLRNEVTSFVSLGLEGSFRSSLMADVHFRKGFRHQVWRLFELLKHANRASLQERVVITTGRVIGRVSTPAKRIGSE